MSREGRRTIEKVRENTVHDRARVKVEVRTQYGWILIWKDERMRQNRMEERKNGQKMESDINDRM